MKPIIIITVFSIWSITAMFLWNKGLRLLESKLPTDILKRKLIEFNKIDRMHIGVISAVLCAILAHFTNILLFHLFD